MKKTWLLAGLVAASVGFVAPAFAQQPTIPVIVKDTTSFYWQIVLAGARKAGKDLGVNVPELGAQSEADVNGQISILENAVAGKPAAIVISPTAAQAALGKPIDEAAKSVKIIGIDSAADSKAFTSFLTTDNVQGGRIAADGLAAAITRQVRQGRGRRRADHPPAGRRLARRSAPRASRSSSRPSIPASSSSPTRYADGQATTGLNITTDLITAIPNLRGIFASNLIMAQGAGQAIAENKARRQGQARRLRQRRQARQGFLKDGVDRRPRRPGPLPHGL